MSYKITIVDNKDGKVLFEEENAKAIIDSVVNDEHVACLVHTACTSNDILNALSGVESAKKALFDGNPLLKLIYELSQKDEEI